MKADCAFFTGESHDVCQDYATAGISDGIAYAIISDGCSGSPNTDFGSRLLTLGAVQALSNFEPNSEEFFLHTVSVAQAQSASLGLEPTSIDATLLTLTGGFGRINGSIYGDGFVAVKYYDYKLIQIISAKSIKEVPSYPSYLLDAHRAKSWSILNPDGILVDNYFIDRENMKRVEICDQDLTPSKLIQVLNKDRWLDIFQHRHESIEWISIMSDGANTFSERPDDSPIRRIEDIEVLSNLLDFKGSSGVSFVKRQTNWFKRSPTYRTWHHDDDLSIAAISFGK
jgi:hypothetical protein